MKVAIVGKGNLGSHLFNAFGRSEMAAESVDSRTLKGIRKDYDVILLAVADSSIGEVAYRLASRLKDYDGVVAHTAGSVSLEVLSPYFNGCGVFYPLQTFSKDIVLRNYREIPIFVEASDTSTQKKLTSIARRISDYVYELTSTRRKSLHLASVFVCNFVNALYGIGEDILRQADVPFDVVHALIRQTTEKAIHNSPSLCQTGPAKRGDMLVIESHLDALDNNPTLQEIYRLLTNYILTTNSNYASARK